MLSPEFIDKNYGVGNYILINCDSEFSDYFLSAGYSTLVINKNTSHMALSGQNYQFLIVNISNKDAMPLLKEINFLFQGEADVIKNIIIIVREDLSRETDVKFLLKAIVEAGFECDDLIQNTLSSNNFDAKMIPFAFTRAKKNNQNSAIQEKDIEHLIQYIRPNEDICIISDEAVYLRKLIRERTTANRIEVFENISEYCINYREEKRAGQNQPTIERYFDCFFIISRNATITDIDSLIIFSGNLSPGGRIIFQSDEFNEYVPGKLFEIEAIYKDDDSVINNESGCEVIKVGISNFFVVMKSPLEDIENYSYIEKTYSYATPPKNLLMFERDYTNPWIVKSVIEFPTRNRNKFALRRYAENILKKYDKETPDYAAAIAILGYQALSDKKNLDKIIFEIANFVSSLGDKLRKSPHQIRWLISLSVLGAEILKLQNKKDDALKFYLKALSFNYKKFSPTIGTKILQAYYNVVVMLYTSGEKSKSIEYLNKSLEVGVDILNVSYKELFGLKENPLSFTLFIYHDILDWLIKLSNLKKYLNVNDKIIPSMNKMAWAEVLKERMLAIGEMEHMIRERDKTIMDQGKMLEERMQGIYDLEDVIKSQREIIEERWDAMQEMEQMIIERDKTISELKLLIQPQG